MSLQISTGAFPPPGTQELGFVYGTSCLSRNLVRDLSATARNATLGGELRTYADMMAEGLELAKGRMLEMAENLGADGVYAVQVATPQVAGGAAEIIIYGTAFRRIE